jgi:predicted nucleic acid-binding protein
VAPGDIVNLQAFLRALRAAGRDDPVAGPRRILVDTMIFDRIVATRRLTRKIRRLARSGRLLVLTTHVQEDELAGVASRFKRARLARIPRDLVPTSHFVIGHSRFDLARIGDDPSFEQIRGTGAHTKDGLIGATALAESAVLVTEDRRLGRRASDAGVEVWTFAQFVEWVEAAR